MSEDKRVVKLPLVLSFILLASLVAILFIRQNVYTRDFIPREDLDKLASFACVKIGSYPIMTMQSIAFQVGMAGLAEDLTGVTTRKDELLRLNVSNDPATQRYMRALAGGEGYAVDLPDFEREVLSVPTWVLWLMALTSLLSGGWTVHVLSRQCEKSLLSRTDIAWKLGLLPRDIHRESQNRYCYTGNTILYCEHFMQGCRIDCSRVEEGKYCICVSKEVAENAHT